MNLGQVTLMKVDNPFDTREFGNPIALENFPDKGRYSISLLSNEGNSQTFVDINRIEIIRQICKFYEDYNCFPKKIVYSENVQEVNRLKECFQAERV